MLFTKVQPFNTTKQFILSDLGQYECVVCKRLSHIKSHNNENVNSNFIDVTCFTYSPRLPSDEISVDIPMSQSTPMRPRGEPPEFIRKLRDQTVKENDNAQFVCLLLGHPEPTYQWFKDDQLVNDSEKHKLFCVEDVLTLEVLNCTADDEGMYKCEAVSQCGKDMTTARLTVEGKPRKFVFSNFFLSFSTLSSINPDMA